MRSKRVRLNAKHRSRRFTCRPKENSAQLRLIIKQVSITAQHIDTKMRALHALSGII